jgi:hypothetical protein
LKRRACAAVAGLPDRNADLLALVGEVGLNTGAREHHNADPEPAFACLVQSGLNSICGTLRLVAHLAAINSAPFGGSAMEQDHARMLRVDLVEWSSDGP